MHTYAFVTVGQVIFVMVYYISGTNNEIPLPVASVKQFLLGFLQPGSLPDLGDGGEGGGGWDLGPQTFIELHLVS